MKIHAVSDLHWYENEFPEFPGGDVLIIAGDCTGNDSYDQWLRFSKWFNSLDYKKKILVGGNHDGDLQIRPHKVLELMPDAIYLQDSGVVIEEVSFYGSPWTPEFGGWHFMLPRDGEELKRKWDLIPQELDFLITHGPPFGILDEGKDFGKVGDQLLLEAVKSRKIGHHIFGHIHDSGQQSVFQDGTEFHNVAYLDEEYEVRKENWVKEFIV